MHKKILFLANILLVYCSSLIGQITVDIYSSVACEGTATQLSSLSTTISGNIISYQWDLDNDGLFDDATDSTISYNFNTSASVTVGLKVYTDFPDSAFAYFTVNFNVNPVANFTNTTVCEGGITYFNNISTGATTYEWDFDNTITSTLVNPIQIYATGDTFQVQLIAINSGTTCRDTITKPVIVRSKPTPQIIMLDDAVICEDNGARIVADANNTYFWSTGVSDDTIYVSTGGWYFLTEVDVFGCIGKDSILITLASTPFVNITLSDTFVVKGETISLSVEGADVYEWQPETGISDVFSSNPKVTPEKSTWYTVTGSNSSGCFSKDSIFIEVYENYWLDYTNVFTPNGDGKNDVMIIRNDFMFKECIFEVYNQWGIKIFESENITLGWDGTYNNSTLPSDTYYFTITCNKEENSFSGTVTILR